MPDEQTKAPRTMSTEREAEIRASMTADYDYGDVERISGEGQEVLIELSAERAVSAALLKALKLVWAMLDDGRIVRNIANDHNPDWALKMLTFTRELQTIQSAIALAEARHE